MVVPIERHENIFVGAPSSYYPVQNSQSPVVLSPSSISSSTISDSDKIKPKTASSLNAHLFIILFVKKNDELNKEELLEESLHFDKSLNNLKKENAEKEKELSELAKRVVDASTWNTLKEGSFYFANAAFLIGGLSAGSTVTVIALTAGGTVALVNKVVTDTGLWQSLASYFTSDVDSQKSFSDTMSAILSWGSSIASVGGIVGGWFYPGTFAGASLETLKGAGYFASSISTAVTGCKSSLSNSKVAETEKVLLDQETIRSSHKRSVEESCTNIESISDNSEKLVSKVESILAALRRLCKGINQN